jgi:hypothetical protein
MNQEEKMYQEEQTGGSGSVRPSANESEEREWLKYLAFCVILAVLAVGIVLSVI